MYTLNYNDRQIEYEIIRRKRKTIGITITLECKVIVSAPKNVSKEYIERLILRKANWIHQKLDILERTKSEVKEKGFVDGENLFFMGKSYIIKIRDIDGNVIKIELSSDRFEIYVGVEIKQEVRKQIIRESLEKWYRQKAKEVLAERTQYYSKIMKLYPNRICIKEQKTLWGSCSSKNNINYNWKLIMAPIEVLDYVVAHELAHMKHMNHSKDFWNYVEVYIPNWKERRNWLKANGNKLKL